MHFERKCEMMEICIAISIIFVSACIHGIAGFGFSLFSAPLLCLIFPIKIVVPTMVVMSIFVNLFVFVRLKEKPDMKSILTILIPGVLVTPIGAYALKMADERLLKAMVGIFVLVSAFALLFGFKIKLKNKNLSYVLTGVLSGLLNGSISVSGPPVILLLRNEDKDKMEFRTSLTSYFLILKMITMMLFVFSGQLDWQIIKLILFLIPGLFIGVIIGVKIGNNINEAIFKKATNILLIAMGAIFLMKI
ncbi:MAG: sulfite exporter TauE/SafE family protein [Clostridiales bacterium]|nr:MAG: sulfite exporter TauE/SafE family protein [Clostridiales bacterium]